MTERIMVSEKTGTIVILNGTSSSGKSSIVRALQGIFEEPYLEAGLDKFLWMLPKRYLNRPLWDEVLGLADRAGPVGHRLVSGMHQAIAALSRAGNTWPPSTCWSTDPGSRSAPTCSASSLRSLWTCTVHLRCLSNARGLGRIARWGRPGGSSTSSMLTACTTSRLTHPSRAFEECALVIKGRITDGPPFDAFARLKKEALRRSQITERT